MLSAMLTAVFLGFVLSSSFADPIHRSKRDSSHGGNTCATETDVAFVLDSSGSITSENWPKVLEFVKRVVEIWDIGSDAVRIGIETFGNRAYPQFHLNTYDTKSEILSAIDRMEWKNENTNTSGAIWYMCNVLFTAQKGDRPDARNIAFIMTDGKSSESYDGNQTIPNARMAREKGVSIFAIGVGDQYDREELFAIAGEKGRDETLNTMPTVDGMPAVIDVEDFDSLNDIEHMVVAGTTSCFCREENDIAIIVDVSASMSTHTENIRDFLVEFIGSYITVGQSNMHIALITYSDSVKLEFNLAEYFSAAEMAAAIMKQLTPLFGHSNTASAFKVLSDQVFLVSRGLRPSKRQVIVLFTDGNSDDMDVTLKEAAEMKERHFEIIVVAVGKWVNRVEAGGLASDPDDLNVLAVTDSQQLGEISNSLRNLICVASDHCSSNPCVNDGDCHSLINNYYCDCERYFLGKNCEDHCQREADVVFIVDTSSSVGQQGFHDLLEATKKLALNLHSDREDIGVAVETFSDDAVMVFDLNDGVARGSQLSSLHAAYRGGTTDTAKALGMMNFLLDVFKESPDKRSRVAVLLTNGKSNDFTRTLKAAAESHSLGIHIITAAVRVNDYYGHLELQGLTSNPDADNLFYFNSTSDLLRNISDVKDAMMEAICNHIDECSPNPCQNGGTCVDGIHQFTCECSDGYTGLTCERRCDGRMDIVFALDVSGSIRRSRFHFLKEWVHDFVTELEVREGRTRVGILLFSDNATIAVDLEELTVKEDILQAIDILEYTGGRTNIALAIAGMRSMLKVDLSSETNSDIRSLMHPRYGIIITDGHPTVDVLQIPAQAIQARIESVQLVVVAIESNFENEMFRLIANDPDPSNLFAIKKFSDLLSILDSVIKTTCNSVNECASSPCTHGATCLDQTDRYFCECAPLFGGVNCERECISDIDLAFVFDSSGSVEKSYHLALNASRRIVQELSVGDGNARLAALNFHEHAHLEFGFDEHYTAQEVVNAIDFIHTGGSSNIYSSFDFVIHELFTGRNGDRSSKNVAILFTDGTDYTRTSDEIQDIVKVAEEEGILRIVVALGARAAPGYLASIASSVFSGGIDVQTLQKNADIDRIANVVADALCKIF